MKSCESPCLFVGLKGRLCRPERPTIKQPGASAQRAAPGLEFWRFVPPTPGSDFGDLFPYLIESSCLFAGLKGRL